MADKHSSDTALADSAAAAGPRVYGQPAIRMFSFIVIIIIVITCY